MAKKQSSWDKQHSQNTSLYTRKIDKLYETLTREAAAIGASVSDFNPDKPFSFADYPQTRKRLDDLLKKMQTDVQAIVVNGIEAEWTLSNNKNSELARRVFGDNIGKMNQDQYRQYFNNNHGARDAFIARKTNGMNLSDRVWKYTGQFKEEIEMGLDIGLRDGASAAEMARDLKQYLQQPDKLFRRVRDEHGQLRLSKNAKAYNPGRGVYRSSRKNAERLARTETNMAYKASDYERWQQFDFVVGIEVHRSNNPYPCPLCESLSGKYPKEFKFGGWHPQCRCFATSILKTPDELHEENRQIMNGEPTNTKSVNEVTDMPENFTQWLSDNEERFKRAGNIPYFIRDNGKHVPNDWINGISALRKKADSNILTNAKEWMLKLKDPTFVTETDVKNFLLDYAKINPQHFNGDLKQVKISRANSAFMSNTRKYSLKDGSYFVSDGNVLTIHNKDFVLNEGAVFNPLHEFKDAMKAIAAKKTLTFNQEYAIESMWHEIRHAGAVGWKDIRKQTGELSASMECINQFCARRSYGGFLRAIGGTVSHEKDIITKGFGYSRSVRNFEKILDSHNISPSSAHTHFSKMIMSEPYENIQDCIISYLTSNGIVKIKAERLIKGLRLAAKDFDALF